MKHHFFIIILISLIGHLHAQQADLWQRIDSYFGLSSTKNIDTSYYRLSDYGWMANVNNNFAVMHTALSHDDNELSATSAFNYTIGLTAGYRNLILGYSFIHPAGSARDMTLSLSANAWGVEFRRYSNTDLNGQLDLSTTPNVDINEGDIKVEARYLRAYHVFSPRKFSMTAALDGRCHQLRSAGSVLFYTDYARHAISLNNNTLQQHFDHLQRLAYTTAALGLGYAYNYTPNRGRLLIHASAVPMFVVVMDEERIIDYQQSVDHNSHFRMSCISRLAATYHLNEHLGLNLTATYNFNRLPSTYRASWTDLYLRATLLCRF